MTALLIGSRHALIQVLFLVIVLLQHLVKAMISFGFRTFFGGKIETAPLFVTLALGIVKVYDSISLAVLFR